MPDKIERLCNSVIQHGRCNDRIYLMKLDPDDCPEIIESLRELASGNNYSKIFGKIPKSAQALFVDHGYKQEAYIPGFFKGGGGVCFMSKFLTAERSKETNKDEIVKILDIANKSGIAGNLGESPDGFELRECSTRDITDIAELYGEVFETYPFPIDNPDYIRETMINQVIYFGAWSEGILTGLSSAEMDRKEKNVEMTDFAVSPEFRGNDIALHLLHLMDEEMRQRRFTTAYTIARSLSYGMNITFAKLGYLFAGTLINNTNISGHLESMNVWYKQL